MPVLLLLSSFPFSWSSSFPPSSRCHRSSSCRRHRHRCCCSSCSHRRRRRRLRCSCCWHCRHRQCCSSCSHRRRGHLCCCCCWHRRRPSSSLRLLLVLGSRVISGGKWKEGWEKRTTTEGHGSFRDALDGPPNSWVPPCFSIPHSFANFPNSPRRV